MACQKERGPRHTAMCVVLPGLPPRWLFWPAAGHADGVFASCGWASAAARLGGNCCCCRCSWSRSAGPAPAGHPICTACLLPLLSSGVGSHAACSITITTSTGRQPSKQQGSCMQVHAHAGAHLHVGGAGTDGGQRLPPPEVAVDAQHLLPLLLSQEHVHRQVLEVALQGACGQQHRQHRHGRAGRQVSGAGLAAGWPTGGSEAPRLLPRRARCQLMHPADCRLQGSS
jgi:hypothetical protein